MSFGVDPNPYVADYYDALSAALQTRTKNTMQGWPLAGIMKWLDDVAVHHNWTELCTSDLLGESGFMWNKYLPQEADFSPAAGIPSGLDLSSALHKDFWRFFRDVIAFANWNTGFVRSGVPVGTVLEDYALVGEWPDGIGDFLKRGMPDQESFYRHTARGTAGPPQILLSDNGAIRAFGLVASDLGVGGTQGPAGVQPSLEFLEALAHAYYLESAAVMAVNSGYEDDVPHHGIEVGSRDNDCTEPIEVVGDNDWRYETVVKFGVYRVTWDDPESYSGEGYPGYGYGYGYSNDCQHTIHSITGATSLKYRRVYRSFHFDDAFGSGCLAGSATQGVWTAWRLAWAWGVWDDFFGDPDMPDKMILGTMLSENTIDDFDPGYDSTGLGSNTTDTGEIDISFLLDEPVPFDKDTLILIGRPLPVGYIASDTTLAAGGSGSCAPSDPEDPCARRDTNGSVQAAHYAGSHGVSSDDEVYTLSELFPL